MAIEAPDLDVTRAQREVGAAQVSAAQFQSLRSQGVTEGSFTVGTRAARLTTTGTIANDRYLESDTRFEYRWTGTAWEYIGGFGKGSTASFTAITVSSVDNGAEYYVTDAGSWWYVAGGVWTERAKINVTTEYRVNGAKVVGARGAAIADVSSPDATDLASAITLANELKSKLNTSLARDRAHGLIAP